MTQWKESALAPDRRSLVVLGHGMVGHKFVTAAIDRGLTADYEITVLGEESRPAYDRVALSTVFAGSSAEDLSLLPDGHYPDPAVTLELRAQVTGIDRAARTVTLADGRVVDYDVLVLATGSYPFVPPVPGREAENCFVYRTIDDLDAIRAAAVDASAGAVIGGGLLGLEAANALLNLGLTTHVVEMAPRLMPLQVDEAGGAMLARHIRDLGVHVHLGATTEEIVADERGRVAQLKLTDAEPLDIGVLVFSAGIRPRDELARACGLEIGPRGGVVVDENCRTSDPAIFAVGEVACAQGVVYGLVAPGYAMAETAATAIAGDSRPFTGADLSTKLKLMGVDVASFGDAFATTPDALELTYADPITRVYKKLVVSSDGSRLLGGVLVGDASAYLTLRPMAGSDIALPANPEDLILPPRSGSGGGIGPVALPDEATICSCENVEKGTIVGAVTAHGCTTIPDVKGCTKAGTGCGSCVPLLKTLLDHELTKLGVTVSKAICEHFAYSRAELFDIVRVTGARSFSDILASHGTGRGCDICKPVIASILASRYNEHVLEGERGKLQDTNDHLLANMQRNGTYSVVPRIPGGEITPEGLILIGEVAKEFGLYTKITGGQRIDLFGARAEQLPLIWKRLVDGGFESGHAYGKSLRTIKSCVGSTWCRYGVQDSVGMAIALELRYRGLRAPHKLKSAVSGCARECAEARGKDFGIIATEKGWNLYVGGNGGMTPKHAIELARDLDDETLIRYIDRFLMFYIRTADRLQRTAPWLEALDGGIEYLKQVLIEDSLGICADLEADMARHVATYADEWAATIADPEKLKRFVSFVNAPDVPDPTITFVDERGQIRPAQPGESGGPQLVAGPTLKVGAV
ncbi:nitrite reductase large subunit NirB [Sporichthya polymorpha]|uniref:nitrite reductase large subunit NirB n=1 Tax=Sporichthya polymorpha TaxID=35751 RepID=UPI001FE12F8C|nr:nitrite reductase large subunit NirB [Sporichthya polymorpha]